MRQETREMSVCNRPTLWATTDFEFSVSEGTKSLRVTDDPLFEI